MQFRFYMSHLGGDTITGVYGVKNDKNVQTQPLLMNISKLITKRKRHSKRLFADFREKLNVCLA